MKTQKITFGKLSFSVDKAAGVLTNLALITAGREATGHGIYIDAKTLSTALAVVGNTLKAYITHGSIDDYYENGFDRILKVPGFFSAISIQGDSLVAGKFEFYDAFKKHHTEQFDILMEMAEKTPELFGLSIEAYGTLVSVAESGTEYEYGEKIPEGEKLMYGGMPALRVTELQAASFVSEPAANDGLFAKLSKALGKDKGTKLRKAIESAIAEIETPEKPAGTTSVDASANNDTAMLTKLKTHFTDKARLSRAVLLFADDNTLTVEAIEAKLAAEDTANELTSLRAEVTSLKSAKEQLEKDLKAANDGKASAETALKALRESGHDGKVNLGNGGGTEAPVANPYAKDTWNLTSQARLEKEQPDVAAALKAAAGAK